VPAADLPPPAVGIGDLLDEYDAREQKQAAAQQQANLLEQQAMAARQRREMERRQAEAEAAQRASEAESDDEGSSFSGWIVFFLIFGVGNVILYLTTGWILIPK
jgi:multidrug efflux pump subunit AcrA (membrane-fusion protein)